MRSLGSAGRAKLDFSANCIHSDLSHRIQLLAVLRVLRNAGIAGSWGKRRGSNNLIVQSLTA